jgi:lipopolysaccharide/colanic/teichoic acid biosynthesis glycosyltransferase
VTVHDAGWVGGPVGGRAPAADPAPDVEVAPEATPTRWLRARTVLDRAVAAVLLVPTGPLLLVLGLLVRRQDGGPALVRLPRVGRYGDEFRIHKLRTMRVAAPGDPVGSTLTAAGDHRITPLGHALRRWRVDELAQLLDVVGGRMALLGPRPETPPFVDRRDPRWVEVLSVRPGIAGPTQVIVHGWEAELPEAGEDLYREVLLPVKLAIDAWYLRHASPLLDVRVVVALVQSMVGRPRTVLHRLVERAVPGAATLGDDLAAASAARTAPHR